MPSRLIITKTANSRQPVDLGQAQHRVFDRTLAGQRTAWGSPHIFAAGWRVVRRGSGT
jgi:hypothetical protein